MRRAVVSALAASIIAVMVGDAQAFVRRRSDQGHPVFWAQPSVPVTLYFAGFDQSPNKVDLSVDETIEGVFAAARAWTGQAVECPAGGAPSIEIVASAAPVDATPPPAANDGRNSIIFRTEQWGPVDAPYDPAALAYTGIFSSSDGKILDADIEINATNGANLWTDLDSDETVTSRGHVSDIFYYDLQTALTHEFGHFIGLNHTCYRPSREEPDVRDDRGLLIPDCDQPSAEAVAAVMFATIEPSSAKKRWLTADDVEGVCAIYPPTPAPSETLEGGCAIAARGGPFTALAALVGALVAARARRRVSARGRARS